MFGFKKAPLRKREAWMKDDYILEDDGSVIFSAELDDEERVKKWGNHLWNKYLTDKEHRTITIKRKEEEGYRTIFHHSTLSTSVSS